MTVLVALKKLILGETWLLPAGVAAAVAAALVARHLLGAHWHELGGFILLVGVIAVLVTSVGRSAGAR
jgi:membrane protein implicated in regulation of membrane protease activity